MTGAHVYILRCRDNHYYVGSTRGSLERRVSEHNAGIVDGYTRPRRPVTLVYSQWFERMTEAFAAERQLKGWSRAKKEALISGDWSRVSLLAAGSERSSSRASSRGSSPRRAR